jgi:4'-phosphopantetheinyl transferase
MIPLDVSGSGWQTYSAELPDEEKERTRRYHYDADRLRFAKCRCLLRRIIADWKGIQPMQVTFRLGKNGKPFLCQSGGLQFNISHTHGSAIFAFCHEFEIGIDIEHIERDADFDGVALKVFTTMEQNMLRQLNGREKRRGFFRLWTAKEAFMKATGRGFSLDPSAIETSLPENPGKQGTFNCATIENASSLLATEVPTPPGYQAMLCAPPPVLSRPPSVTCM